MVVLRLLDIGASLVVFVPGICATEIAVRVFAACSTQVSVEFLFSCEVDRARDPFIDAWSGAPFKARDLRDLFLSGVLWGR